MPLAARPATRDDPRYQARLRSAADAVALIPDDARISVGMATGQPRRLLAALADRARAGDVDGVGLYYLLSTAATGDTVLHPDVGARIRCFSMFNGGVERAADRERQQSGQPFVDFIPTHFSASPRVMTDDVRVDTMICTASPMDADGNFSLGTCCDYSAAAASVAGTILLEVNPNLPFVPGGGLIPVDRVSAIVEDDTPLITLPRAVIGDIDRRIATFVAERIPDGACLQMGIGALPEVVCQMLMDHRHLGIHTEMMTSGLADLMRAGAVDNSRKRIHPGKTVFTFALGDEALYDYLRTCPDFESHSVAYTNDPCIIALNDDVISVNATMQVDLAGACNSEFMNGRQFSGSGGQLDFVRGAYKSTRGQSIITCHSTAAAGTVSRIVPRLDGPVTTPRTDVHCIATEYGLVDLKGKSLAERARALIGIAHPDFRDGLDEAARAAGYY